MSELNDLRVLREIMINKQREELEKSTDTIVKKIIEDLRVLTKLDFKIDYTNHSQIFLIAETKEKMNNVYINLEKELLELEEIEDQTTQKIYFETLHWYFRADGNLPDFLLDLIKEKEALEREIDYLNSELEQYQEEYSELRKKVESQRSNY